MAKTVLLDLDGTLVDSVPDLRASANRLMASRGLAPFTRPEVTAMVGDGAAALVRRLLAARGHTAERADLQDFLADYTAHAADETQPYPGVPETLAHLQAEGWTLAVVTNKPEAPARHLLDRLGLLRRFATIVGGDTLPTRKPDPAQLLHALTQSGGAPSAAIMIGDHHNDIAAAQAAHIPSIFAEWGYGTPDMGLPAQARARSFDQIPTLATDLLTESN